MKVSFAVCVLLILANQALSQSATNCAGIPVGGVAVFNVAPYSKPGYLFNASDSTTDSVEFSICLPQVSTCNVSGSVFAIGFPTADPDQCFEAASNAQPTYNLTNSSDPYSGLTIIYPPVTRSDNKIVYLNVTLLCQENQTSVDGTGWVLDQEYTSDSIMMSVTGYSYYGCPYFTADQFYQFLEQYQLAFVCIFFLLGVFITLFGLKMFNITIFLVTAIAGTFICGNLFYEKVSFSATPATLWVVFGACVLIGCILGYLAVRFEKVGFFALGFALGVIGAVFLYQGILAPFLSHDGNSSGTAILYVSMAILGLIGGGLSLWIWKDIVIIATSVIGSFVSVRAVSVYTKGFPSVTDVAGGLQNFSVVTYVYLILIIVWAICGMVFQFKNKKREDDERDEANPQNIYKNMMADTGY